MSAEPNNEELIEAVAQEMHEWRMENNRHYREGYSHGLEAGRSSVTVTPTRDELARAYDPAAFEDHSRVEALKRTGHIAAIQWAARRMLATEAADRMIESGILSGTNTSKAKPDGS